MKTYVANPATRERNWVVVDASGQRPPYVFKATLDGGEHAGAEASVARAHGQQHGVLGEERRQVVDGCLRHGRLYQRQGRLHDPL